jgi:hypothetical protein
MMDVVQHVAAALIRVIEGDESLCKELTEAGIEVDCTLFHELRESKAGSPRQPGP